MKTIDVFILQELVYYSDEQHDYGWETRKLTASKDEADEWDKRGFQYDYEKLKLNIPEEIQVQRDY